MDENPSTTSNRVLDRFCHQYLQLQLKLDYPDGEYLRNSVFQKSIFSRLFQEEAIQHPPPKGYQFRVLKEFVKRIEESIQNWDEEELNDDLFEALSLLISSSIPSDLASAQEESYVTYSLSLLAEDAAKSPTITLREARNVLAASGTTGLRTWEAALHFGNYLIKNAPNLVEGKSVLELGAGTGYLSMLCAKHLKASYVLATDGSGEVVEGLQTSIYLNDLHTTSKIDGKELKWGYPLMGGEEPEWNGGRKVDLVIGADLTYYETGIPPLLSTFDNVFELYPNVRIIIAATIRNEETFRKFLDKCAVWEFLIDEIDFPMIETGSQQGPFYEDHVPIKILDIRKG
ncbi:S-adenosyl-L-methionine-dependent methyltransferase [Glarea lozoyensis ATCC 20868]|uniref:S-adenosyl-L-methionine-dependent methyltransferase n=1 Tax=Glarea lozoyensis (strain ATCC 20868 / MF5171) TaxID=1116229 RepID=S3DRT1_GLAL2|nr:S-adenosyl-L-methionine-dependent methyltransferase [Glarea lozoyensis ATCC 20868]EPE34681.1 S-adenosyl-L-methionine-dependent methyltransferase [Glarea lozoyensis ATCC 20868]